MSPLFSVGVRWRRLVARRPWIYWMVIAGLAVTGGTSVHRRIEGVEAARRQWGDTRRVLVVSASAPAGAPIVTSTIDVPLALVPTGALDPDDAGRPLIARNPLRPGNILTDLDVGRAGATPPLALVPDGWLAVAVIESPASGAQPGDRVVVVSEGVVLEPDAIVIGHHEEATLVAVPAGSAPLVPAAATSGSLALLLRP
jgi:hypothetical protein